MSTHNTIPLIFQARAKEFKDKTALIVRDGMVMRAISWHEFGGLVKDLALGLISLGVGRNERVAILSENRPEWAISDMAVSSIGAVTVPIYTTLTTREVEFILKDSSATVIILSGDAQLKKILSIKEGLKRVIIIDDPPGGDGSTLSLSRVMAMGAELRDVSPLEERKGGIKPDDIFTIIYTSGTTGRPKGVVLTHWNLLSNVEASLKVVDIREEDTYLSYLPLSHSFERLVHLALVYRGATIAYSKGFAYVAGDMEAFRPTVMIGVPFFFEMMRAKVLEAVERGSAFKKRLFRWAYGVGEKAFSGRGKPLPPLLRLTHHMADRLVLKAIRDRIGSGIRFFISGGGPLPVDIAEFFWALGIPVLEGYGLTETSPVVSVNTMEGVKPGSVGRPIPGVEVRIAQDGEIWVKGPNVMKGYLNMPEATAEVIVDGWLRTGDIGNLDKEGLLTITDRKKDIIVTALGKNIPPQKIEAMLRADEYIREALVFGDRRPHLVALIVPEVERLKDYARERGIPFSDVDGLIKDPEVNRFYEERIRVRLKELPRFERVWRFSLIPGLAEGELTPTMKVKRKVVEWRYRELIEGMYKGSY